MDDIRNRLRKYDDYVPPAGGRPSAPPPKPVKVDPEPDFDLYEKPTPAKKPKSKKTKKKKRRRGLKVFLFLMLLLIIAGATGYARYKHLGIFRVKAVAVKKNNSSSETNAANPSSSQPTIIRFVATGDMLPYAAILHAGDTGGGKYDFTPMFKNISTYFNKSDVRFCNQATPSGGAPFGITGYPSFNAPLEWQQAIVGAGCNLIGLASNNINDKGQGAIDATVSSLTNKAGVLGASGANSSPDDQAKVRYFTVKGLKFAFVAYTTSSNVKPANTYGVNIYNDKLAQSQINEAKTKADFIIVSMHWGKEDSNDVVPEQDVIGQQLANLGVNVVLGHGSHRLQPVKLLNGVGGHQTLVWYSLGNSLNAQLPIESLIGGLAVMDIDLNTKKVGNNFMPIFVNYEWTAQQRAVEDLLSRKNFSLIPLNEAAPQLAASGFNTTVAAQTARVTQIMNKYTPVTILTSTQFLDSSPIK